MQFDESTSRQLESLYTADFAVSRRQKVLSALHPQKGERVIDIGTGPGFLACEIAGSVGPEGRVFAVDKSEAMLQLAQRRCRDLPWVKFQEAEATQLPANDTEFDAAVSVQVLEFVEDATSALQEMYRVLKPGGRAVIVCTDWDSLIWHATDQSRMQQILRVFEAHAAHTDLPRTLASRLNAAGFKMQEQRLMNQFNVTLDPNSYSGGLLGLVHSFALSHGVTQEEADAWIADLRDLSDRGEYFFCVNQFLFLACRERHTTNAPPA